MKETHSFDSFEDVFPEDDFLKSDPILPSSSTSPHTISEELRTDDISHTHHTPTTDPNIAERQRQSQENKEAIHSFISELNHPANAGQIENAKTSFVLSMLSFVCSVTGIGSLPGLIIAIIAYHLAKPPKNHTDSKESTNSTVAATMQGIAKFMIIIAIISLVIFALTTIFSSNIKWDFFDSE